MLGLCILSEELNMIMAFKASTGFMAQNRVSAISMIMVVAGEHCVHNFIEILCWDNRIEYCSRRLSSIGE